MRKRLLVLLDEMGLWARGWYYYIERKLGTFGNWFEKHKSVVVDLLMIKRGSYQRPFLHFSLGALLVIGLMSAPVLASRYPGDVPSTLSQYEPPSAVLSSLDLTEYGVQTKFSEKPRDQVVIHVVQSGDTLSKVAEQFGVSIDTIKWANDLRRDALSVGQELKIPPVTGVIHKVKDGETVYSIAKKYKTDAQKIVNFPFNDFVDLDTFALAVGQSLIVPDGVLAEARPIIPVAPPQIRGSGQLQWPATGSLSQYPVWYHMALDIANPSAPPIVAADSGTVTSVQYLRYGYGQHIVIDHGNGLATLYAHLQEIYVKVGDKTGRGQVIGRMGSTGRSTGTHLHFEVRKNGATQNPLPYLR